MVRFISSAGILLVLALALRASFGRKPPKSDAKIQFWNDRWATKGHLADVYMSGPLEPEHVFHLLSPALPWGNRCELLTKKVHERPHLCGQMPAVWVDHKQRRFFVDIVGQQRHQPTGG